ncbi:MAG: insulinase family protein [bacterium]|nr:insulinase family protein [Candidatus Kapabacteria bacterium]
MSLDIPIDRSHPPLPGPPSEHAFPAFSEQRLSNGVAVYLVENHAQPYVSLTLTLRSGSSYDGDIAGLASFVGGILLSGAGTRNAEELAEAIDFLGATIDVSAGRDDITIKLGVLTRYLPEALDFFADLVLRPTFPSNEIARERRHSIASLKQAQSDPAYLASVQFRREAYGSSPYGTEVDGTAESIARIRRKHCVDFHRTHFTSANSFIVAAGDVDEEVLLALLEERFGTWSGDRPAPVVWHDPETGATPRVVIVDRHDAMQSAIRVGAVAISRTHPDFIPLVTLHTLFGGYFNSRINQNLRERNAFTYGAGSSVEALAMPGSVSVRASVGIEVTGAAVREVFNELRTIASELISLEELEMVTNYILGLQSLQIETPGQVAGFVRTVALYDLPHDYYERFPDAIRAVTRERILEVAKRYMDPNTMIVVVVGDAAKIKSELEEFGPVSVVGAEG